MPRRSDRRDVLRQLGENSLQQLVIRRYHETVRIVFPEYGPYALIWYFYGNDTFNACVLERSAVETADSEALGSLLIRRSPDTQQIVHVMVYEFSNWLYSHRLREIADLPGLPSELVQAINTITEEQLPHSYPEDNHA